MKNKSLFIIIGLFIFLSVLQWSASYVERFATKVEIENLKEDVDSLQGQINEIRDEK